MDSYPTKTKLKKKSIRNLKINSIVELLLLPVLIVMNKFHDDIYYLYH